jgi:16S rRNA processing protein RimM
VITLGEISGIFGVKGALKIFSFTEPRENILAYPEWVLTKEKLTIHVELITGRRQGKTIVAQLDGVSNRERASEMIGYQIQIDKALLPATEKDEYYWQDLIGLKVETLAGLSLGHVHSILETGANDVLIVKGDKERLIPFLQPQTIVNINLETQLMRVDWDSDF